MTLVQRAERLVNLIGGDAQKRRYAIRSELQGAVMDEREACVKIAEAIDSNRGNEAEIARSIRAR